MPRRSRPRRSSRTTLTQRCTSVGRDPWRGGDRVEPWPQRRQRRHEVGQPRPCRGERRQQIEQIGVGGFGAVGTLGQQAEGGGVARMGGGHREQVGGAVQRAGNVELAGEGIAQGAGDAVGTGHRLVAVGVQGGDARGDEVRFVGCGEADRVARFVGQPGVGQVDHDVADVLGRAAVRSAAARTARGPGRPEGLAGAGCRRGGLGGDRRAPRRGTASAGARWPCRRARRARWRFRGPRRAPRCRSGRGSRTGRSRAVRWRPSCGARADGPPPASGDRAVPGRGRARGSLPPARASARRAVRRPTCRRRKRRRRGRRGSRSATRAAPARTAHSRGSAVGSPPLPTAGEVGAQRRVRVPQTARSTSRHPHPALRADLSHFAGEVFSRHHLATLAAFGQCGVR